MFNSDAQLDGFVIDLHSCSTEEKPIGVQFEEKLTAILDGLRSGEFEKNTDEDFFHWVKVECIAGDEMADIEGGQQIVELMKNYFNTKGRANFEEIVEAQYFESQGAFLLIIDFSE